MGFQSKVRRGVMAPQFAYPIITQFKLYQTNLLYLSYNNFYPMSQAHHRALSAHKPTSIHSSNPRRRYERVNTDNSQPDLRDPSLGSKKRERESFYKRSRNMSKQLGKEPEQLLEENLNLKNFINSLQDQLSLQRSRLQMNKKKNEKFARLINRQFQKQLYYSGKNPNSYVISGVKAQYENIKTLYEQKCNQLECVLKTIEFTAVEELRVYIETIEAENKVLKNALRDQHNLRKSLTDISPHEHRISTHPAIYRSIKPTGSKMYTQNSEDKSQAPNQQIEVLTGLLAEQRANISRANSIIERYSQKVTALSQTKQQYIKKVEFLQRLVIEKDNNEHEARRELKRVEKERNQLQEEISRLKEEKKSTEAAYTNKLQKLQDSEAKKYEIEKAIFDKNLLEKNQYIAKLQKQIRSLSTILCYWKPLDQRNQMDSQLSRHDSPNLRDLQREDKASSLRINPHSEHYRHESIVSDHSGLELAGRIDLQNERSTRINRQEEGFLRRTTTGNRSNSYQDAFPKEKPRIECSKKYREVAKKTRKVDLNEIRELGELLRYRLIGHQVSIEKAKLYFDVNAQQDQNNQYIKMKNLKATLQQHPFNLKEDEATLVSRYIVEDSANEYVYLDEENEINRSVAKSIIRAFIGAYELPDTARVKDEWSKLKTIYLSNIVTALKTIAPKGIVTLKKFSELLVGLGIEMAQEVKEWMVSQLVIKSASLQELQYKEIEVI